MKNLVAVLVFGSTVAALTMLAKSNLVLPLLSAALLFAATVLPFFAGVTIKLLFRSMVWNFSSVTCKRGSNLPADVAAGGHPQRSFEKTCAGRSRTGSPRSPRVERRRAGGNPEKARSSAAGSHALPPVAPLDRFHTLSLLLAGDENHSGHHGILAMRSLSWC